MNVKNRYILLSAFIGIIIISLACTLGSPSVTPEATAVPITNVTPSPTTGTPTVPPSGVTVSPPATGIPASDTPVPPTLTPTATPIVGTGPNGCVLRGTYFADVTIPDGTQLAPSAPFVKTWRIRNDGTCQWEAGYQVVYAEGNQMSGPAAANIPAAAPGQTIDISVNLIAPGAVGDFTGRWRLRASNGAIFGGYTVVIRVVGTPTSTPTATATSTPIGGGLWGGTWVTDCAGSTCGAMNLVQTGSTVAGTYANGEGIISGAVSGNRLSGTWTRGGSSGSFDFWIEGSGLRWHGNWNKAQKWCGQREGQSPLTPCGVSTWYGTWATNCDSGVPCGDMTLNQSGDTVNGSYAGGAGLINGAVKGVELTGTWTRNPGSPSSVSGTFKFFMTGDGQQFQGNYNTTFHWCGNRAGASLPDPCLKN